jgi:hypothetical protein
LTPMFDVAPPSPTPEAAKHTRARQTAHRLSARARPSLQGLTSSGSAAPAIAHGLVEKVGAKTIQVTQVAPLAPPTPHTCALAYMNFCIYPRNGVPGTHAAPVSCSHTMHSSHQGTHAAAKRCELRQRACAQRTPAASVVPARLGAPSKLVLLSASGSIPPIAKLSAAQVAP